MFKIASIASCGVMLIAPVTAKQAEIAAIRASCNDAIKRKLSGQICIYSDCTGAINALGSYEINSKQTMECINALNQLARTNEVDIIWLPAHSGIYGNETADKIAKFAARETTQVVNDNVAAAKTYARTVNNDWLAKQTSSSWLATQKCAHTKYFLPTVDPLVTKQLLSMSKSDIRIITGIITGHCRFNSHLAKLGIRDDPDCDLCGTTTETARHILCDCSALATQRQQIFNKCSLTPKEICRQPLHEVVDFYKKCSETIYHISLAFQDKRH